jgi:hypothetical protein
VTILIGDEQGLVTISSNNGILIEQGNGMILEEIGSGPS